LEDKKKLYVGNLPYSANSDELRKVFSEFGEVVDAVVISDKYSGRSKGFGFVPLQQRRLPRVQLKK